MRIQMFSLLFLVLNLALVEGSGSSTVTKISKTDLLLCRFYPFYFECPEKRNAKRAEQAATEKTEPKRIDPCKLFPYWNECGKLMSAAEKKFDLSK